MSVTHAALILSRAGKGAGLAPERALPDARATPPRGAGLLAPLESTRSWHCCEAHSQGSCSEEVVYCCPEQPSQELITHCQGVGLSLSNARPARRPGGPAPSCLGSLSPGRLPLLPAAAASFQLVVQFSLSSPGPTWKPAGSPSSGVTWYLGSPSELFSADADWFKDNSFPAKSEILCPSSPRVRGNWVPARQNPELSHLVLLFSLSDSSRSPRFSHPQEKPSLHRCSLLVFAIVVLEQNAREVPVLGPALGCLEVSAWNTILRIFSHVRPMDRWDWSFSVLEGRWPQVCLKQMNRYFKGGSHIFFPDEGIINSMSMDCKT